ncbi:hypothetical protein [Mycolicibacterium phlei]|uniref:hypothetical protein n=1 Tax=Mycolicibacterium phlei TaxID=1771 RepID=UPI0002DF1C6F|nr:hypothetical protein [Mycolicibacterium phlei]MBF4194641.1 hypothetical protein [Mycolicibacterium phlei]
MKTYTTRSEAVLREIVEPIEASGINDAYAEYDVDAIAEEVLDYRASQDARECGYRTVVEADEFWRIVAKRARRGRG